MDKIINRHAALGHRVILLARHKTLDDVGEPVGLIAISDRIRPAAAETIAKFQKQGVTVKVISGDHAQTVSTIAKQVGIINADKYISCESLADSELIEAATEYTIFGRVTPEQKVLLIKTLKENGHTVAMTGDGVNDTLALKESNCAIAMADGSEVARKISQIVLMDSDFGTLPDVVREGRRCINNVRQSASLFLMKTILTICLTLYAIVTVTGYPFEPVQFTLLELFVIGISSVLLAIEPNNKRIEGTFLKTVIVKSVPSAVVMFIPTLLIMIMHNIGAVNISNDSRNSVAMIVLTLVGLINMISICIPFTKWRACVCAGVSAALVLVSALSILLIGDPFMFKPATENTVFLFGMVGLGAALAILLQLLRPTLEKLSNKVFSLFEAKTAKRKSVKK